MEKNGDKHREHIYNESMDTGKTKQKKPGLGKAFQKLREQQGLSIGALATKADIPRGTLYKLEDGDRLPQVDVALKLCWALDVEITDFVSGTIKLTPVKQPPPTLADLERLLSSMADLDSRDRRFILQYATEATRQNRKQKKKG